SDRSAVGDDPPLRSYGLRLGSLTRAERHDLSLPASLAGAGPGGARREEGADGDLELPLRGRSRQRLEASGVLGDPAAVYAHVRWWRPGRVLAFLAVRVSSIVNASIR